jgi:hypothetical protein
MLRLLDPVTPLQPRLPLPAEPNQVQTTNFSLLSSARSQQKRKFNSFSFSLICNRFYFFASELPLFWSKLLSYSFINCCWEGPGDLGDFLLFGLQYLPAAVSTVILFLLQPFKLLPEWIVDDLGDFLLFRLQYLPATVSPVILCLLQLFKLLRVDCGRFGGFPVV